MLPVILAVHSLLHILIRLTLSSSAELDEAEQLLLSQSFAFGYPSKPPLYTWLVLLVFEVFGINLLALTLLKNILLYATHFCVFLAARNVLGDPYLALLTSLALWLMPQIAWESHRDLTHSVLATSLSAAVYYVGVRLLHTGYTRHYVVLGLLYGLGALAKPNFLVFALALLAAIMSNSAFRPQLLDRRMFWTGGVAGLVVVPHLLWILSQGGLAVPQPVEVFNLSSVGPAVVAVAIGLAELVWASIRFMTPLWIVYVGLFPRILSPLSRAKIGSQPHCQMLERLFVYVFSTLAAFVIVIRVENFKDRWMQPLLFLAPLYLNMRLQAIGVPRHKLHGLAYVLALCGLLSLTAPLAQAWIGPWFGTYSRLHVPFAALTEAIKVAGFRQGTIVADSTFLGGNLRLVFTASRILTPALAPPLPTRSDHPGQCLVVWESEDRDPLPLSVRQWAAAVLNARLPEEHAPRYVEAPYIPGGQHTFQLGFLLFPGGLGDCR